MMVVKEIINRLLEEVEKLEWWFEQDIDDEGEEDEEGDGGSEELKAKHPFKSAPSLPDTQIDRHPLIASQDVVLDRIKSFPRDELVSSITQVVNLFLEEKCPTMLGEYIASAPLTPLVKPGGGIRPIVFGVGILGGGEAILHAVNRLVEDRGDDVGLLMLLVDFQNAFNLSSATLALPDCTTENTPSGHAKGCSRAWYLDDGTIVGDTLVVGKVLELITEDGPRCGLHLNVDKIELFWPKEDPRSSNALVMKRVSKTIRLLDAVAKINDPQCELLLIRACAGISKLYLTPHGHNAKLAIQRHFRSKG
ncbi:hypothetical protein Tco_1392142 [Tanacetum coccineum]